MQERGEKSYLSEFSDFDSASRVICRFLNISLTVSFDIQLERFRKCWKQHQNDKRTGMKDV